MKRTPYLCVQGAHFVECDVVLTKDCQAICRHEPDVSQTTDALHKFPHLLRNDTIDGLDFHGIFTTDLTLAQVKTLRAKERLASRDQSYNFLYEVPTLQEYLDVIKNATALYGRVVGAVPETKHPTWFQQNLPCLQERDTNISAILLQALQANGFNHLAFTAEWSRAPAIIQSFEIENLQWLNSTSGIPLLQLLDEADLTTADNDTPYGSLMTDEGLSAIATYAQILGNWKGSPVPPDGSAPEPVAANLTKRAQAQGLLVTPYTFRNDDPWNSTGTFIIFFAFDDI
ncbi:hypothetical protein WJX73_005239 [Symbiochloris irregularis]|uniref:glycerophosphodiester phosphodiesterase n=1 Tax=Symbiochloris irregularis TaxID=706552 RepID=A0AAW1NMN8_9CHLO